MFSFDVIQALSPFVWIGLACAAMLAGFMDAVVGGGGLIQVPAVFMALPNALPATVLGTNKISSIFGTATAVREYTKKVRLPWGLVSMAAVSAFLAAILGARSISFFPTEAFKKVMPFVLLLLLVYVLFNKQLGIESQKQGNQPYIKTQAVFWAGIIGFYDGVFGPGTGSFLVFMWIRCFGFEFLTASAAAKVVNFACNLGAVLWFGFNASAILLLGLWMAMFNVVGAIIGSRMALRHGVGFVRNIFILVVTLLIIRLFYSAYI